MIRKLKDKGDGFVCLILSLCTDGFNLFNSQQIFWYAIKEICYSGEWQTWLEKCWKQNNNDNVHVQNFSNNRIEKI